MPDIQYHDKHGVRTIWPGSDSTRERFMRREEDPFPAGFLMGGKRYWRRDHVTDWLARQEQKALESAAAGDLKKVAPQERKSPDEQAPGQAP